MSLIDCKNASFAYDDNVVLTDINFSVSKSDYICIVGENGSGKSTLMKGLLNLKKPFKGEIIFGENLNSEKIGYLPQQTAVQKDFPASVYEVVISGRLNSCGIRPFYNKADKKVADENLKLLDIWSLKDRCYQELSGGQQQRVLLARALCAAKEVLLLDEPVSGLDPLASADLYEMIKKINEEKGIGIIMVSHDIGKALDYAKHILHLRNKVLFFGQTKDYIDSDIGKYFLGGKLQ